MRVPGCQLHPRAPEGSSGASGGQSPSLPQSRGQALMSTVSEAPALILWLLLPLPTKSWERRGPKHYRR